MNGAYISLMLLCITVTAFAEPSGSHRIQPVTIDAIKAHPMRYDGKIVSLEGWLASGHLGVFVYSASRTSAIYLRSPDEVPSVNPRTVTQDKLFEHLWKIAEREISGRESVYRVKIQGLVRILKADGKPAKEFCVFGQFPTELVPLRVLEISIRSEQQAVSGRR